MADLKPAEPQTADIGLFVDRKSRLLMERFSREHLLSARRTDMLFTIAAILVVLWLLGAFAFHVGGGLIHLILVVAVIVVIVQFIQGRRL
jgi:hypothetical protein